MVTAIRLARNTAHRAATQCYANIGGTTIFLVLNTIIGLFSDTGFGSLILSTPLRARPRYYPIISPA
jgi:hypothetical protein